MNKKKPGDRMLSDQQGRVLLRLARQTIQEHLHLPCSDPATGEELRDPALGKHCGVFVTLHTQGRLRGCIGSLMPMESIADGVRRHAVNAAFHDHRFPAVEAREYGGLEVEVSVLSYPEDLDYATGEDLPGLLRPGIDGVIISSPGGAGATFLPQVWQQLPDPVLFLNHLCRKAGLDENRWRTGGLRLQTYQVQYFQDKPCCP